jgi:hypothetical protein
MRDLTTTRIPPTRCACGAVLDASSGRPGTVPTAGDLSLCFACGALAQYDAALALVPVALDALRMAPMERAKILRLQATIRRGRTN